ncbi:nucleoside hydrolase-like domain-containing protein [Membranihabitans marinus]|uniref:nucleoside hydrolase-like domain-containing protein n=1 Tax=Membranihabitans marinus TaxID=1227546 RepID=UPI001F2D1C68|nr:nucleoside hydrolase-like domain-containing protein [Membranihabitans marinus]
MIKESVLFKNINIFVFIFIPIFASISVLYSCSSKVNEEIKPRILISSDIGGTDPDDFQSMIHLLMYADLFQIEGLVSSPYGMGRKQDFLDIIDLYEEDFPNLKKHSKDFPSPTSLREVCKQGGTELANYKGYGQSTEGSNHIIHCANKESDQPLWVLVWGGLEDLAQALHDDSTIVNRIKVYWIGGPNKKWSANAYNYIADHHPNLWIIEANATYRGWFMDDGFPSDISSKGYYDHYIQGKGVMGKAFKNYYDGQIKMGDTPSLAYLMDGDSDDATGGSWGGQFTRMGYSSRSVFYRNTTVDDTLSTYAIIEWRFPGPRIDIPQDSVCFKMEISKQIWHGYYLGNGQYGVRYSSKKPERASYKTQSQIEELNNLTGQFVSIVPWPGERGASDYSLGQHWYGDRPEAEYFISDQQGAKTVSKYRKDFLMDWAQRWTWLAE